MTEPLLRGGEPRRPLRHLAGALRRLVGRWRPDRSSPCSGPTVRGSAPWPAPSRASSLPPGKITFDGTDITGQPGPQDRKLGLTYIPEGRGIFPGLSVVDNLRMAVGAGEAQRTGPGHRPGHRPLPRARGHGACNGLAASPVASSRCWPWPGPWPFLPGSSSPTRCRSGWPRWWPSPCSRASRRGPKSGITIVLIEQFVHRALQLADHCVILTRGQVGWSGAASQAQQEVLDRYLGEADQGAIASV